MGIIADPEPSSTFLASEADLEHPSEKALSMWISVLPSSSAYEADGFLFLTLHWPPYRLNHSRAQWWKWRSWLNRTGAR